MRACPPQLFGLRASKVLDVSEGVIFALFCSSILIDPKQARPAAPAVLGDCSHWFGEGRHGTPDTPPADANAPAHDTAARLAFFEREKKSRPAAQKRFFRSDLFATRERAHVRAAAKAGIELCKNRSEGSDRPSKQKFARWFS